MNNILLFLLILISTPLNIISLSSQSQVHLSTTSSSTPIPSNSSSSSSSGPTLPACHLDLSAELFGGVSAACSTLDRHRCCPVLAAWLFSAHARSALSSPPSPPLSSSNEDSDLLPLAPDDSQRCVDSLHASLASRHVTLPAPNATCDTVLCFCGIRLHQIGSLTCPAAFTAGNLTVPLNHTKSSNATSSSMVTATAAVKQLEKDCRNSSYAGCTRCLRSLEKVKTSVAFS